jgi:hypothetical protein
MENLARPAAVVVAPIDQMNEKKKSYLMIPPSASIISFVTFLTSLSW